MRELAEAVGKSPALVSRCCASLRLPGLDGASGVADEMKYLLPDEITDRLGAPDDELMAALQSRLDDYDTFPLAVEALGRLPASRTTLDLFRRWDPLEPPLTEVERLTRMARAAAEDPTLGAEAALDIAVSKEAGAVDAAIREAARCPGPGAVRLVQRLCDGRDDLRDRALAVLARLRDEGALPASLGSIVPSAGQQAYQGV